MKASLDGLKVIATDYGFLRGFTHNHEESRPRVHGNGFIQVDLTPTHRAHYWGHPDIPRQKKRSPIHDHIFGFMSCVLKGRLVNIEYVTTMGEDFDIWQPVRGGPFNKDVLEQAKGTAPVGIDVHHCDVMLPNRFQSQYHMPPFRFHETHTDEPAVTIIEKDGPIRSPNYLPRILVPHGGSPDVEFDRYAAPEETLWGIIKEIINA